MVRINRRSLLQGVLVGLAAGIVPKLAAAAVDLENFILSLVDRAIKELTGPNISLIDRSQRLKQIFTDYFDMASAGKFVLGSYWRSASEEERKEFLSTFLDYMSLSYAKRFGEYAGQKLMVSRVRQDNETTATVFTILDDPTSQDNPPINWVIRTNGDKPRIVDVQIAGLSLLTTQRDEFAAVMVRSGGVPGLIKTLHQKMDALKAATP